MQFVFANEVLWQHIMLCCGAVARCALCVGMCCGAVARCALCVGMCCGAVARCASYDFTSLLVFHTQRGWHTSEEILIVLMRQIAVETDHKRRRQNVGYLWLMQFRLADSAVNELWIRVENEGHGAVECHYCKCRVILSSGICIRKILAHFC